MQTDSEINELVAQKLGVEICKDSNCPGPDAGIYTCESAVRNYSTSIKAAWEILESQSFFKICHGVYGYRCNLGEMYPGVEAEADTAPMAICLAFLKLNPKQEES